MSKPELVESNAVVKRDIWRMANGRWGAEVERNDVGARDVSLLRADLARPDGTAPDEFGTLIKEDRR